VVDLDAPALLAPMRDALDRNERIEIEYYSASSDTNTEREIDLTGDLPRRALVRRRPVPAAGM